MTLIFERTSEINFRLLFSSSLVSLLESNSVRFRDKRKRENKQTNKGTDKQVSVDQTKRVLAHARSDYITLPLQAAIQELENNSISKRKYIKEGMNRS